MKQKVYTSIYLSKRLKNKLAQCVKELNVDEAELLSVLCYKAGKFVCKKAKYFKTVEYQERGQDYDIVPVYFFTSDHEYMHANRLGCKISVSKLLACAMVMFLDEIMEKGINRLEIAQLKIIQDSYDQKSHFIRNYMFKIVKNDQFHEYKMKLRLTKT